MFAAIATRKITKTEVTRELKLRFYLADGVKTNVCLNKLILEISICSDWDTNYLKFLCVAYSINRGIFNKTI